MKPTSPHGLRFRVCKTEPFANPNLHVHFKLRILAAYDSAQLKLNSSWEEENVRVGDGTGGDQIIGLRYSMDDKKSAAKESEETVKATECALLSIEAEISRLTQAALIFNNK